VSAAAARVGPWLLFGERHRRLITEHVRARAERWQRDWLAGRGGAISVDVHADPDTTKVSRVHESCCFEALDSSGERSVLIKAPARSLPHLAGLHGPPPELAERCADRDSLAGQLETEALRRLAESLLAGTRLEMAEFHRVPGSEADAAGARAGRHPVALMTLGDMRSPLVLMISPEFATSLLPLRRDISGSERLERRSAAICEQTVSLDAVLGQVEVCIAELASLAVGDVIVMNEALCDSVDLTISGGARVGRAVVGQSGGRRAVQIKGKFV
jgi:flagellar motor switch/type III secretory pathway protein FliN